MGIKVPSYPYMQIAKKYNVDYTAVLLLAEQVRQGIVSAYAVKQLFMSNPATNRIFSDVVATNLQYRDICDHLVKFNWDTCEIEP